jgi:phospholipase/carboxylesterase
LLIFVHKKKNPSFLMSDLEQTIAQTLDSLMGALAPLGFVARHIHPGEIDAVLDAVGKPDGGLTIAIEQFRKAEWPQQLTAFRTQVEKAADATLEAWGALRLAAVGNDIRRAYRALRSEARAQEALFPLARIIPQVSLFFLDPEARENAALKADLAQGMGKPNRGVLHAENTEDQRGGFSLFVPEDTRDDTPRPLVIALHGGSGHGRSFLWHWVRTARSRGLMVATPTSIGSTWALAGEDVDTPNLHRIIDFVSQRWPVDTSRLLLTGMSDGGTFTLLSGVQSDSRFTHLAPFAASFHPILIEMSERARLANLPIHLCHGELDWMFPVDVARTARDAFQAAGAAVTYLELDDLSHTYPRDAQPALVDWFLSPR